MIYGVLQQCHRCIVKQLVAGGGVALIGVTLIPLLSGLLG